MRDNFFKLTLESKYKSSETCTTLDGIHNSGREYISTDISRDGTLVSVDTLEVNDEKSIVFTRKAMEAYNEYAKYYLGYREDAPMPRNIPASLVSTVVDTFTKKFEDNLASQEIKELFVCLHTGMRRNTLSISLDGKIYVSANNSLKYYRYGFNAAAFQDEADMERYDDVASFASAALESFLDIEIDF